MVVHTCVGCVFLEACGRALFEFQGRRGAGYAAGGRGGCVDESVARPCFGDETATACEVREHAAGCRCEQCAWRVGGDHDQMEFELCRPDLIGYWCSTFSCMGGAAEGAEGGDDCAVVEL